VGRAREFATKMSTAYSARKKKKRKLEQKGRRKLVDSRLVASLPTLTIGSQTIRTKSSATFRVFAKNQGYSSERAEGEVRRRKRRRITTTLGKRLSRTINR